LFFAITQQERVRLIDRIVSLGRTSAKSRVAAVLVQIRDRLGLIDPSIDMTIPMPLNQEEIGDMTGLTPVHVNRTLRALDVEGVLLRQHGKVTFLDQEALREIAELTQHTLAMGFQWLPPAHPIFGPRSQESTVRESR
jgi:CRP-like cAMP-binding protein